MHDDVFSTDLFKENYPELAKEVEGMRMYVGFHGLNKYEIPYVQAKAFVEKRGKLFERLAYIETITATAKGSRAGRWSDILYTYMTAANSFQGFMNSLRKVNDMLEKSEGDLRKVAYELDAEMQGKTKQEHHERKKGQSSVNVKNLLNNAKQRNRQKTKRKTYKFKYHGKQSYRKRVRRWNHKHK